MSVDFDVERNFYSYRIYVEAGQIFIEQPDSSNRVENSIICIDGLQAEYFLIDFERAVNSVKCVRIV